MSRAGIVAARMTDRQLWTRLETILIELGNDVYPGDRPWLRRRQAALEGRAIVSELKLRGVQLHLDL